MVLEACDVCGASSLRSTAQPPLAESNGMTCRCLAARALPCRSSCCVLDVDGVLTDGRIVYGDSGDEIKAFHVRDGSGLKLWLGAGKKAAVLTGRKSPIVERRGTELGMTAVVQGADDKLAAFEALLQAQGLAARADGLRGRRLARRAAPAPLRPGRRRRRRLRRGPGRGALRDAPPGGRGAVREVIELVLRRQGRWRQIVSQLSSMMSLAA